MPAHGGAREGDPFIASVLMALHQIDSPGALVIHDAPQAVRELVDSTTCVTIPLAQGGRVYALLVIEPGDQTSAEWKVLSAESQHSALGTQDFQETVSLAVSHSTVALERAELFEQTLAAARQSSMLYSIAAEVQTSLDPSTVMQMTVNGALEALPIRSCEVYIFDEDRKHLRLSGRALAPG